MGKTHNRCLTKKEENTYLETYNCEYIKSPKPERFARAMVRELSCVIHTYVVLFNDLNLCHYNSIQKQLYRPGKVK